MDLTAESFLIRAIQTRLSLTPTMQVTIRQLGLLTRYFGALGCTVGAKLALEEPIGAAFKTENPYVINTLICLPIVAVFFLDGLPSLIHRIRKRRRNAAIVRGQLKKGYCRLTPLDEDSQDTFNRLDGAHEKVFHWILKTNEPILFLSGMSGCGKSSLLSASVVPRLRDQRPAYITLSVRSFEDPLHALREALTRHGLINDDKQAENLDVRVLLEAVCRNLKDRRLLILFDQFEELLVVHGEEGQPTQRAIELLKDLKEHPIERLTLLVVFRTEYQGLLIDAGLGPLNSESNWNVVDPFTTSGAASFLENSGLKLKNEQITTILTEASLYEKTKGFVRPIVLNMVGLALDRIAVPKQAIAVHGFDAGGILLNYTTESLESADPNGFAKTIMKYMLSADGTKIPKTVGQLHEKTELKHGNIESLMLNCEAHGLVRLLDESRRLWEISHDFVANLIARAIGRDNRTFGQKARPVLLALLLMSWIAFAAFLFFFVRKSFEQIIRDVGADYAEAYDPNNRKLNLAGLAVRDHDIGRLKQKDEFKELASLMLDGCKHLTDAGVACLKDVPLRQLDLGACARITDAGLEHLKDMPLEQLRLSFCFGISDAGLEHLKDMRLEQLDLVRCLQITNAGLRHLRKMPLERLSLSFIENIGDDGLKTLKDMKLKQLDLTGCNKITDAGLKYLQGMPLEQLKVTYCDNITDAGLEYLEVVPLK